MLTEFYHAQSCVHIGLSRRLARDPLRRLPGGRIRLAASTPTPPPPRGPQGEVDDRGEGMWRGAGSQVGDRARLPQRRQLRPQVEVGGQVQAWRRWQAKTKWGTEEANKDDKKKPVRKCVQSKEIPVGWTSRSRLHLIDAIIGTGFYGVRDKLKHYKDTMGIF